jgi:hypothetical protein
VESKSPRDDGCFSNPKIHTHRASLRLCNYSVFQPHSKEFSITSPHFVLNPTQSSHIFHAHFFMHIHSFHIHYACLVLQIISKKQIHVYHAKNLFIYLFAKS